MEAVYARPRRAHQGAEVGNGAEFRKSRSGPRTRPSSDGFFLLQNGRIAGALNAQGEAELKRLSGRQAPDAPEVAA